MHFGLTDEQDMIVDTVRTFVENEIYPHEDLVERTGEVPQEIADERPAVPPSSLAETNGRWTISSIPSPSLSGNTLPPRTIS